MSNPTTSNSPWQFLTAAKHGEGSCLIRCPQSTCRQPQGAAVSSCGCNHQLDQANMLGCPPSGECYEIEDLAPLICPPTVGAQNRGRGSNWHTEEPHSLPFNWQLDVTPPHNSLRFHQSWEARRYLLVQLRHDSTPDGRTPSSIIVTTVRTRSGLQTHRDIKICQQPLPTCESPLGGLPEQGARPMRTALA